MITRKSFGLLALACLAASALLSGCGGSSTETAIPSTITVFNQHSVFFRNHSTMTAGYNGFGQLGDGTLDSRARAEIVPGLGHMDGLAAGAAHTLVFANNSSVMAWGSNNFGQLGNAGIPTGTISSNSRTPVRVGSLTHVTSVAAGAYHSLAVSGGKVFSWGGNGAGQLGLSSLVDASTPAEAGSFTDAIQVAAGALHSLALTQTGAVWAWGDNTYGQLGSTPTPTSTVPVLVSFPGSSARPIQIAAAGRYSLALMDDGTVWAWGYNRYGQLGTAVNMGTDEPTPQPARVVFSNPATSVTQISAGFMHVLALVDDGTVWGWGLNKMGQLGNNPLVGDSTVIPDTATPVQALKGGTFVGSGSPITGVQEVQTFGNSSFATLLNPGTGKLELWGWGDNSNGQLGVPVDKSSLGFRVVPVQVGGF